MNSIHLILIEMDIVIEKTLKMFQSDKFIDFMLN